MDVRKKILLRQIGAKVAYYRTLRGLKQEELAALAHISQSVLSRIECGRYNDTLSVPMLMNIADGLQIDMALLVSFNEVEKQMWWQPLSVKLSAEELSENPDTDEEEGGHHGDDGGK